MEQRDPIFICRFANGHETCTAVFCSPDNLDPERGLVLARPAFSSLIGRPPHKIVGARFEFRGKVLAEYNEAAIAALTSPETPVSADPRANRKNSA